MPCTVGLRFLTPHGETVVRTVAERCELPLDESTTPLLTLSFNVEFPPAYRQVVRTLDAVEPRWADHVELPERG